MHLKVKLLYHRVVSCLQEPLLLCQISYPLESLQMGGYFKDLWQQSNTTTQCHGMVEWILLEEEHLIKNTFIKHSSTSLRRVLCIRQYLCLLIFYLLYVFWVEARYLKVLQFCLLMCEWRWYEVSWWEG